MSYIDQMLSPIERVVYRARVHWAVYLPFFVLGIITLDSLGDWHDFPALASILVIVMIATGVAALVRRKTSEFAVTDKRVLIKVGLLSHRSLETLLVKIEGIQVAQGLLGRLLGYGTIVVVGTGGSNNSFRNIADPLRFRQHVQQQIERANDAGV